MPEEKSVIFTVPGAPMGKQRPRYTMRGKFASAYTPKKTRDYEDAVKVAWFNKNTTATPGEPFFHADDALDLVIFAYMPVPQSAPKSVKLRMLSGDLLPGNKPDWDNIGKIICDALNGIAYHDDCQIVSASVYKEYKNEPCTTVFLRRRGQVYRRQAQTARVKR